MTNNHVSIPACSPFAFVAVLLYYWVRPVPPHFHHCLIQFEVSLFLPENEISILEKYSRSLWVLAYINIWTEIWYKAVTTLRKFFAHQMSGSLLLQFFPQHFQFFFHLRCTLFSHSLHSHFHIWLRLNKINVPIRVRLKYIGMISNYFWQQI